MTDSTEWVGRCELNLYEVRDLVAEFMKGNVPGGATIEKNGYGEIVATWYGTYAIDGVKVARMGSILEGTQYEY